MGGDPDRVTPDVLARVEDRYGLDDPMPGWGLSERRGALGHALPSALLPA